MIQLNAVCLMTSAWKDVLRSPVLSSWDGSTDDCVEFPRSFQSVFFPRLYRMGHCATDISYAELFRIIRDFGVDRFAKNIAKHIVQARKEKPIETTGELNAIIRGAIPMKVQVTGGHPSKRTYQAIRIELNHELDVLRDTLDTMIDLLNDGGRICIITFHSLEDRIVKSNFKKNENPCTCPSNFPVCVCGKKSKGRVVTRKPVLPSEKELEENSRSKSAKLRVFERVEDGMESREAL